MIIDIDIPSRVPIALFPKDEIEEITQNIRTIVSTACGSIPLDRSFGIDTSFIDEPLGTAGLYGRIRAECIKKIPTFEPRVKVQSLRFIPKMLDEKLTVRIEVMINEVI